MSDMHRHFDERLFLRVPRGLGRALDELAAQYQPDDGCRPLSRSDVIRNTLIREVKAAGVDLSPAPDRVLA